MTGSAPILLVVAFVLALSATFYNWGVTPAAGQPWYGRIYFHTGWAAIACYVAWLIWK